MGHATDQSALAFPSVCNRQILTVPLSASYLNIAHNTVPTLPRGASSVAPSRASGERRCVAADGRWGCHAGRWSAAALRATAAAR